VSCAEQFGQKREGLAESGFEAEATPSRFTVELTDPLLG
jgi:hypothetical protein